MARPVQVGLGLGAGTLEEEGLAQLRIRDAIVGFVAQGLAEVADRGVAIAAAEGDPGPQPGEAGIVGVCPGDHARGLVDPPSVEFLLDAEGQDLGISGAATA